MNPAAVVRAEPVEQGLSEGLVNPGYVDKPAWFANSFLDIREDVGEAASAGKRVILYFYQDGCPYCKKLLDTNFALQEIENKTRKHYEVIAINMWGDREVTGFDAGMTTEKAFAKSLRVMFTPTLLFLNEQGSITLRVNGYYPPHKFNAALDYAAMHDGVAPTFRDYYSALSPVAASGALHTDATYLPTDAALDERDGRPLLVLFEQKDCAPCDELHLDILSRPQSREQLQRLDVVLLDMWSNELLKRPDGKTGSIAQWARELNVQYAPSLVFFDAQGIEVFRTEAWLKAFHVQSAIDYVASGAYRQQPSFQRFISARADALEAQGVHVDIMK
jgi:thioredoxin-related protein